MYMYTWEYADLLGQIDKVHRRCPSSLWATQPRSRSFRRCFTIMFRHSGLNSSPGTSHNCGCQTGSKCFRHLPIHSFIHSFKSLLLPHLTAPAGVPLCPLDSLAPLDIRHQTLPARLSVPQTELQAPAMHCWWMSWQQTLHFFHNPWIQKSSDDFNLRLVNNMQQCVWSWLMWN